MLQKLFLSVILIGVGLLCLNATLETRRLSCNSRMQCKVYTINLLKGNEILDGRTFSFKQKDFRAICSDSFGRKKYDYSLYLMEGTGANRQEIHYYKGFDKCNKVANALNYKLEKRRGVENFNLSDNYMQQILLGILGVFVLFLGILAPFCAKPVSEMTPEEKAKMDATSKAMRAKVENLVAPENVQNLKNVANNVEDITNNPLFQFLKMFLK